MDIASQNQALLEAVSNMEVLENPQVLEIFTEPDNPGEIITASAEEDIAKVQISDVTDETEEPVFQQPQVKSEAIGTSETISASENISTSENAATIASENTGATEITAATVQKERSMSEMAATAVSQSQTTSVNTVSELQNASEDNTVSGSQGMLETAEVEASNISETAVSSESIDSSETVSLKSEKQVMKTDLNSDSSSDERSFDDKSENRVLHTMINEQMQPEGVFEAFDVQPKYTSVNTTDIIRQIVDQISIAKTTGESVIEMQLNPENLGKLYINVTERNSEITARIAVSNETVKNALESQMAALRENLQDANIRVNDVEITIATHEFERNLEQNAGNENGRQDGQQFTHQSSSNGGNRTGHNEAASDEAGLVAQIMRDNGNSVDFMA